MTTFPQYRKLPGVNASTLKLAAVSPKHYHYSLTHDRPDSPAMQLGRAVHTAVLEPDKFPLQYTVYKGAKRGTAWNDFLISATADDLDVLNEDQYATALAIRDAVRSHPVACELIAGCHTEETIVWADLESGLQCKARCDLIDPERGRWFVADLKTARDISPRVFGRAIHDLSYHVQSAHYTAGAQAKYGREFEFWFIAVESSAPFDVRVGRLSEDALYAGEQERRRLLSLVAECSESGEWPGAYPVESEFDLPPWAYPSEEEIVDRITVTRSAS